jgi:hypothetical protein
MPNTYTLIKGETLASSAASYTFTAIPSTFTDLVLRVSVRSTLGAGETVTYNLVVNGDEGAVNTYYSRTVLTGNGSAASSTQSSNAAPWIFNQGTTANAATSNTFSNNEYYIPNYAVTANKVLSGFEASENNATTTYLNARAGLYRDTTAITSLAFKGTTFATGSSFYLYGIKNS